MERGYYRMSPMMKIPSSVGLIGLVLVAACSHIAGPVVPTGDAAEPPATRIAGATKAAIAEYSIPTSSAGAIHIVSAPKKAQALWFTEYDGDALGTITTSGKITEHSLSAQGSARNAAHALPRRRLNPMVTLPPSGNAPYGIVVTAGQQLWFSDARTKVNYAVRVSSSNRYTAYAATQQCCIQNLANGPNKTLWFATSDTAGGGGVNTVSQMTPSGKVTAYKLDSGTGPGSVVEGPDRAMWFTEYTAGRIGRVTTTGTIKEYSLPNDGAEPLDITVGPDHALWFTEYGSDTIGRITVDGKVKQYKLPTGSAPGGITVGPDHALWFTESGTSSIGRISTSGSVQQFSTPTSDSEPYFITLGPDRALWFTEYGANKIGRLAIK
jgi:virginiamycin B lyase